MNNLFIFFSRRNSILSFVIAFIAVLEPQCVSMMAQTSQSSIVSVSDIYAEAPGQVITMDNYAKFATLDNPGTISTNMKDEEASKIFVIYNKGTGKFLTFGGYWGTSARLGSVPCPVWLQLRDKETLNNQDKYLRYPETPGIILTQSGEDVDHEGLNSAGKGSETDGWNKLITKSSSMYLGSKEGTGRSKAKYYSIQIIKADKTVKNVRIGICTESPSEIGDGVFEPNNEKFISEQLTDLDLANGDKLVINADLSECIANFENIFSLGNNVEKWAENGVYNLHVYYTNSSKTIRVHGSYNSTTTQTETKISNPNNIIFSITKDGLTITEGIYHYSIPYEAEKAGKLVRFKYNPSNGKYLSDADGNLILDPAGKAFKLGSKSTEYIYSDSPEDTVPALFISRRITKGESASEQEGKFIAFSGKPDNHSAAPEKLTGVYTDRKLYTTDGNAKPEFARWSLISTGVPGEYRLALDMNVNLETGSLKTDTKKATYYMTVSEDFISGKSEYKDKDAEKQHFYYSTVDKDGKRTYIDHFTEGLLNVKMTETVPTDDYGTWRFVTIKDYIDLVKKQTSVLKETVDMSFMLSDPDFSRNSVDLNNWKVDETLLNDKNQDSQADYYSHAHLRIGYDGYYKTNVDDNNYNTGKSDYFNFVADATDRGENSIDYCANHARYTCTTVQNGGYGKMYQSVKVTRPGWYVVRCQGLSTVDAKLYSVIKEGGASESKTLETPLLKITDQWLRDSLHILRQENAYWPYDQAVPMYNAAVYMNDAYAYPNGVEKTATQLIYYIHNASKESPATIELGVQIPETQWKKLYNTENGSNINYTSDFTAFDNFRLLYGGEETHEPYLLLDENDETLNHLDSCIHKYKSTDTVNKHLLLHRTFTHNQWNTIILPVGLTKPQFVGAFGEDARLAELSSINDKRIYFKTVKETGKYTTSDGTTDGTDYWLKPMTPYLIKIKEEGKIKGSKTDKYTAYLFHWADNGKTYEEKSVGGSADCSYYDIENINMVEGIAKTKTDGYFDHWDFKGMKGDGRYSYVIKGQTTNSDSHNGTVTAYGMLTRNYTTSGENNRNTLLKGHSPMADAYAITVAEDGKPVMKYRPNGGASKAFRCWFRYHVPQTSAAKAQFAVFIDDINEPLSIDDINDNDFGTTTVARYSDGIYTLDGRKVGKAGTSLNALPKGFYIVNGKKMHN